LYVYVANNNLGYSTLAFDRLRIGNSSHGEPKNKILSFLEETALRKLLTKLRAGTFPHVKHAFNKVIGIGHLFGSAQTYQDATNYPSGFDGIVLTGYTMNGSFVGLLIAGVNFVQAKLNTDENLRNYPNGYVVSFDVDAQEYLFFKPYNYAIGVLQEAEAPKKLVNVGEALSLDSLVATDDIVVPVLDIDGLSEVPYCGFDSVNTGNSALPNIGAALTKDFP
jgi:hypothetical protein